MKKKNVNKEGLIDNSKKMLSDFKKFISRGNVVDLAVGVIIGGAFGKIVTSMVNDILTPIIGIIIGGVDFSGMEVTIGSSSIKYGSFIQNVIDFLIVAVCVFILIKIIEKIKSKHEKVQETVEKKKDEQIVLLEEIRDLLKENKKEKQNNEETLEN